MGGGADNRFHIASRQEVIDEKARATAAEAGLTSVLGELDNNQGAERDRAEAAEAALAGGGVASLGGAGLVTKGDQLNTLASDNSVRNILDDGSGNMNIIGNVGAHGDDTGVFVRSLDSQQTASIFVDHSGESAGLAVQGGPTAVWVLADAAGGKVKTTDAAGADRNVLDDGSGNAVVAGTLMVDGRSVPKPNAVICHPADLTDPTAGPFGLTLDSGAMGVNFVGGAAFVNGVEVSFPDGGCIINPSDSVNPRIDTVMIDSNPTGDWLVDVGSGFAAPSPVPFVDYQGERFMRLFEVAVPANATVGTDCTILTDHRVATPGSTRFAYPSDITTEVTNRNTAIAVETATEVTNRNTAIAVETARAEAAEAALTSVINMKIKYGLHGDNSTDDTALIRAGVIAEVAAAISDGTNYRELYFPPAVYLLSGATTTGTPYFGNAQIPLPIIPSTQQKVTLVFKGTSDASACYHWQQTATQQSGTVFHTTLSGSNDGTNGVASVIGGPALAQGYGNSSTAVFSNMLVVIDGISILMPQDPHVCGFDFKGVAEANVKSASCLVATGAALIGSVTAPSQGWQFGLAMPNTDNNDNCNIYLYSAQGMNYGVIASEHTVIYSMRAVYCVAGLVCAGGGGTGTPHGLMVFYASCEACNIGVQFNYDTANPTKVTILMMDYEAINGDFGIFWAIYDPANNGRGEIRVRDVPLDELLNGGAELRVYNEDGVAGFQTAPSVPSTTVAIQNPFFRDCAVSVSGGTVTAITVDGHATGLITGTVFVPTCKTIALTYSVAPSWVWIAL